MSLHCESFDGREALVGENAMERRGDDVGDASAMPAKVGSNV